MKGFTRFVTLILFVGVVLAGFIFVINNTTEVGLWIGVELAPASVGVLIIAAFIAGGVLGLLLGIGILRQLKHVVQVRQLKARIATLEKNPDGAEQERK